MKMIIKIYTMNGKTLKILSKIPPKKNRSKLIIDFIRRSEI